MSVSVCLLNTVVYSLHSVILYASKGSCYPCMEGALNIAMSVSVCLSVCLPAYISQEPQSKLHEIFCALSPLLTLEQGRSLMFTFVSRTLIIICSLKTLRQCKIYWRSTSQFV